MHRSLMNAKGLLLGTAAMLLCLLSAARGRAESAQPSIVGEWVIFQSDELGSVSWIFEENGDIELRFLDQPPIFGGCYTYENGRLTVNLSGVPEQTWKVKWLRADRFRTEDGAVWRRR